jgi:hypothetical protein
LPKIVFFTLDQKLAKPYFSFFSSASLWRFMLQNAAATPSEL